MLPRILLIKLAHAHRLVSDLVGIQSGELACLDQLWVHILQAYNRLIGRWTQGVTVSVELLLVRINYALLSEVGHDRHGH